MGTLMTGLAIVFVAILVTPWLFMLLGGLAAAILAYFDWASGFFERWEKRRGLK